MNPKCSITTLDVPTIVQINDLANAFTSGNFLYLCNAANNDFYFVRIDLQTGSGISMSFLVRSYWGASVILDDCAYIFGGKSNFKMENCMYCVKLKDNVLEHDDTGNAIVPQRYGHAMVHRARSNELIVFGGSISNGPANDMWAYHVISKKWRHVKQDGAILGRSGHGMVYYKQWDCIIVFGGLTKGNLEKGMVHKFNFTNAKWIKMCAMPSIKQFQGYQLQAYMVSDEIVAVLGNQSASTSAHHLYHIPSGKWHSLRDLPGLPERYASCAYGNNGYIAICNRKIHIIQLSNLNTMVAIGKSMQAQRVLCDSIFHFQE